MVARAIFASGIPIISAVGHETDYTIADFAADLRASMLTVAAEMVVPEKADLRRRCNDISLRLKTKYINYFDKLKSKLTEITNRLIDPRRKLEDYRLRLDDLGARLHRILLHRLQRERKYLEFWQNRLAANTPRLVLTEANKQLEQINENLLKSL